MSRFGDADDEPVTFLAVRLLAGFVATVAVSAGVFGDPPWLAAAVGFAVGWAYAGSALLVRRVLG